MNGTCDPLRVQAVADGERADAHVETCPACRAALAELRELKARVGRVVLPAPPRAFDRSQLTLPRRRLAWAVAAAAAVFLAVFFSVAPPQADLYALSARMHDDIVSGRLILSDLGIAPTARRADYEGRCPCPPDLGPASPFVVYRRDGVAVSLLALEETAPAADELRRIGADTVLAESRGGFRLVWIARLDAERLRKTVDSLRPAPAPGLRALTCGACCALIDGRSRGDAAAPVSMELVTASDGSRIKAAKVVGGLRPLGR